MASTTVKDDSPGPVDSLPIITTDDEVLDHGVMTGHEHQAGLADLGDHNPVVVTGIMESAPAPAPVPPAAAAPAQTLLFSDWRYFVSGHVKDEVGIIKIFNYFL